MFSTAIEQSRVQCALIFEMFFSAGLANEGPLRLTLHFLSPDSRQKGQPPGWEKCLQVTSLIFSVWNVGQVATPCYCTPSGKGGWLIWSFLSCLAPDVSKRDENIYYYVRNKCSSLPESSLLLVLWKLITWVVSQVTMVITQTTAVISEAILF